MTTQRLYAVYSLTHGSDCESIEELPRTPPRAAPRAAPRTTMMHRGLRYKATNISTVLNTTHSAHMCRSHFSRERRRGEDAAAPTLPEALICLHGVRPTRVSSRVQKAHGADARIDATRHRAALCRNFDFAEIACGSGTQSQSGAGFRRVFSGSCHVRMPRAARRGSHSRRPTLARAWPQQAAQTQRLARSPRRMRSGASAG